MRIALFATCVVDAMYPGTAHATVSILERLGHDVIFPAGQACCGQMHVNSGYFKEALPVVDDHEGRVLRWSSVRPVLVSRRP